MSDAKGAGSQDMKSGREDAAWYIRYLYSGSFLGDVTEFQQWVAHKVRKENE